MFDLISNDTLCILKVIQAPHMVDSLFSESQYYHVQLFTHCSEANAHVHLKNIFFKFSQIVVVV